MKSIKVVFTRTSGIFPFFIRLVTKSYYNHVYIQYPNGYIIEADKRDGVVIVPEGSTRGNVVDSGFFEFNIPDNRFSTATFFGMKRIRSKYDWKGILGCFLNKPHMFDSSKYYCSRLVRDWLWLANVIDEMPSKGNITPKQLMKLLSSVS